MRPIDLPPADRFPHGTVARYKCGCRCDLCGEARNERERARVRAVQAARTEVTPNPPAPPTTITRTRRDGTKYEVEVEQCPGCNGKPCVRGGTWLRTGDPVCVACVDRATVWNGLVSSARARAHLFKLSKKGVGYKSVAAASDVAKTVLCQIRSGELPRIRARTERRILAVDATAVADRALVDAGPTLAIVERLLEDGFTRAQIAQRVLGQTGPSPALQLLYGGRKKVQAATAEKFRRFVRFLDAEAEVA